MAQVESDIGSDLHTVDLDQNRHPAVQRPNMQDGEEQSHATFGTISYSQQPVLHDGSVGPADTVGSLRGDEQPSVTTNVALNSEKLQE